MSNNDKVMDALQDHLKTLQEDVNGSYGRASEQIRVVKGGLDELKGAVRFQGYITVAAAVVVAIAVVMVLDHGNKIRTESWIKEQSETIAKEMASKKFKESRDEIKKIAIENNVTEDEIKKIAIANNVTPETIKKIAVENNVTAEQIKKIAQALVPTEDQIKKIAVANNVSADEIKKIAVANNVTDDQIKKIAVSNNVTDEHIQNLAKKVALANQRSDDDIKKIALANNRTDAEIKDIANKAALKMGADVFKVINKEIKVIRSNKATLTDHDKAISDLAKAHKDTEEANLKGQIEWARKLEGLDKRIRSLKAKQSAVEKKLADLAKLAKAPKASKGLTDQVKALGLLARRTAKSKPKFPVGLDLSKGDFSKMNFSQASIKDARFKGSNLKGANFKDARLENCDFSGADLRGADLRVWGIKKLKAKGAIYDKKTQFDPSLIDLKGLGAIAK